MRGKTGIAAALGLAGALLLAAGAPAWASSGGTPGKAGKSTADHTVFKELQGPFASGEEVTQACLKCHTNAARQVMSTRHWTWDYVNPGTGQPLGKKTMLNGFCIGDRSNEAFCQSCHVGYGWKDASFDFSSEKNVDCLVCHHDGDYVKVPGLAGHPAYERIEYPARSGKFIGPVDLPKVAAGIGKTRRENCGSCHYYGGGGDGVKHGDLDSSLNAPPRALDVHMSPAGGNFSCATCHRSDGHALAGSRIAPTAADPHGPIVRGENSGRNPATCQACHGDTPHASRPGRPDALHVRNTELLNAHARTLACQSCHIPAFARGGVPTKMSWDWSTAGQLTPEGTPFQKKDEHGHVIYDSKKGDFGLGRNVEPEYAWFDGKVSYTLLTDTIDPSRRVAINTFHGTPGDPQARIWPIKRFIGKQPYDTEHRTLLVPHTAVKDDTAFWYNFDWPKALKAGAEANGNPFSGKFDFVQTEMLWPITHMVAPAEAAVGCQECHRQNGRLEGVPGIYVPARDRHANLDLIGWTLAGLTLAVSLLHGLLRILGGGPSRRNQA